MTRVFRGLECSEASIALSLVNHLLLGTKIGKLWTGRATTAVDQHHVSMLTVTRCDSNSASLTSVS